MPFEVFCLLEFVDTLCLDSKVMKDDTGVTWPRSVPECRIVKTRESPVDFFIIVVGKDDSNDEIKINSGVADNDNDNDNDEDIIDGDDNKIGDVKVAVDGDNNFDNDLATSIGDDGNNDEVVDDDDNDDDDTSNGIE